MLAVIVSFDYWKSVFSAQIVSWMSAYFEIKPRQKGFRRVPCGVVAWLILLVIIVLSQRLSHTCPRINSTALKLQIMANWTSYRFIDCIIGTEKTEIILKLIHAKGCEEMYLLDLRNLKIPAGRVIISREQWKHSRAVVQN